MTLRLSLLPVLVVALIAAACASEPSDSSATSTTPAVADDAPESTSTLPGPVVEEGDDESSALADPDAVAPLTGLTGGGSLDRPALVVKIDDHDRARPQFGLAAADVVYEEVVEGGLTRFAAVFHSGDADPVGPIRSVRTSDFAVLSNLGTPLFANSGGNDSVLALLPAVDMVDVSSNAVADVYHRDPDRSAPHNLVSDTGSLWAAGAARGATGRPEPLFTYRETGDPLPEEAVDIRGVDIDFGSTVVSYEWDAGTRGWARSQNGTPHRDADGTVLAPANVVVQFVSYGRSVADGRSPEAVLVGDGEVWVLTDGRLVTGTWQRETDEAPTVYRDESGARIDLTPGVTWVALPRIGQVTALG